MRIRKSLRPTPFAAQRSRLLVAGPALALFTCLGANFGCETFDPPPKAGLRGLQGSFITGEPGEPVVIVFDEEIVPTSLSIKIVRADKTGDLDPEGLLPDEANYCKPQRERGQCEGTAPAACCNNEGLITLASYNGKTGQAEGATVEVGKQHAIFRLENIPQIAIPYMVVVEPGLEDLEGNTTKVRQRIEFSYQVFLPGPSSLPTGPYFFLMEVQPPPIKQQLRLFAWLDVNQETGEWVGMFTDGNRTAALNKRPGCPADCGRDICQLYPSPACVKPSTNLGTVDEFRDLIPIKDTPLGYTFLGTGFTADLADGTTGFGTPPFPIDISLGAGGVEITALDTVIIGQTQRDETGRWRGSGSATIQKVQINGFGNEPTTATLSFMSLFPDEQAEVESYGEPIYKPGDIPATSSSE